MKTTFSEEEIRHLFEQQEKSAKMLIRRDLELSRANERLHELDQLKSEFISVAAHQLRTPLSGIKWTLSMLIEGDLGAITTEQRTFLMKAYEGIDRIVLLLRDLLLADQIEVGKLTSTEVPVRMGDLLETLLLEAKSAAATKNINLEIEQPAVPLYPRVSVDPKNIRIVFENLIENAVKYTRPGGVIKLIVTPKEQSIVVAVADSGIGIPEGSQKKVFSRFFRAPNAVKEVTDGSGLGLFIVQRLVEKHNGKIWFESIEGKGTTFYVELPVIKE